MNEQPRLGCGAAIVQGGRLLLVRRLREPEAGCWGLPGGKVDWLEPVEQAVRREIEEELAIRLASLSLLCVVDQIDAQRGEHWLAPVYLAGTLMRAYEHLGSDNLLHIGNELAPGLWPTSDLALIHTRREVQMIWPTNYDKLDEGTWDHLPHIGLRYQLNHEVQLFGNISRSVEPPHEWSTIWSSPLLLAGASRAAHGRVPEQRLRRIQRQPNRVSRQRSRPDQPRCGKAEQLAP